MEVDTPSSVRAALQNLIDCKTKDGDEFLELIHRAMCLYHETQNQLFLESVLRCIRPQVRLKALRFRGLANIDDLEQTAMLAVVTALGRFDPSKNRDQLAGFVSKYAWGAIRKYLRDYTRVARVPRALKELGSEIRWAENELVMSGESATPQAIARKLGVTTSEVDQGLLALKTFGYIGFDQPLGDDGNFTISNVLGEIDPEFEAVDNRLTLKSALAMLPERERQIIERYYSGGLTQSKIAATLGISQMHVSRLHEAALRKLRCAFLSDAPLDTKTHSPSKREQGTVGEEYLHCTAIAQRLNVSPAWVVRRLHWAKGDFRTVQTLNGHIIHLYPWSKFKDQRKPTPAPGKSSPAPVAEINCFSVKDLWRLLKVSDSWVEARIGHFAHFGASCTCGRHHAAVCYPSEVLTELRKLKQFVLVREIARAIGRSQSWVEARLDPYRNAAVTTGRFVHYPPEVIDDLRRQSAASVTSAE